MVDFLRCTNLFNAACIHHHQLVGQCHRLYLIMGDEYGSPAEPAMEATDFNAHLDAKLCIEIGQGLIEQEYLRFLDHGACHGNALALPTR